ncbi:adenylate cyclase [Acrasis kona]|uniref:Adenylate cyclase n=1 Tax=Acrasis kona TaxID=1008807 RepID=A0AAW2YZ69_9EUKA
MEKIQTTGTDQDFELEEHDTPTTSLRDGENETLEVKTRTVSGYKRLFSIPLVLYFLVITPVFIAMCVVLSTNIPLNKTIYLDLDARRRGILSQGVVDEISGYLSITIQQLQTIRDQFLTSYGNLQNIFTDERQMQGVFNVMKSLALSDKNTYAVVVVFVPDYTSVLLQRLNETTWYIISSPNVGGLNATVSYYNSSTVQTPYLVTNRKFQIPVGNNSIISEVANAPSYNYVLSQIITLTNTNLFALSKNLNFEGSRAIDSQVMFKSLNATKLMMIVFASLFTVSNLENLIRANLPSDFSFIIVTDQQGSFVASSLFYDKVSSSVALAPKYVNMSNTGSPEMIALERSILYQYGGWERLQNQTEILYNSPKYGNTLVRVSLANFGFRSWYVFVCWPDSSVQSVFNYSIYVSVGIAVAMLIFTSIVVILVTLPLSNSLNRIRKCFRKVRKMHLNHPVIIKTVQSTFIVNETRELQLGFVSVLQTLKNFQKYVPSHVVGQVLNQVAELGLYKRKCTIAFLSVAEFSKKMDGLTPSRLLTVMSEVFEGLSNVISVHGGIIDKYITDTIMVFWDDDDQYNKSIDCALACEEFMTKMHEPWRARNLPLLRCSTGINSGNVLLGNFGSTKRFNFTCLGDPVNLASRIEGLNKKYKTNLLVSKSTISQILTRKLFLSFERD